MCASLRPQLPLIITVDGTIGIITGAITTDITTAGTTICIEAGLSALMGALGIIAIGERRHPPRVRRSLALAQTSTLDRDCHCQLHPYWAPFVFT